MMNQLLCLRLHLTTIIGPQQVQHMHIIMVLQPRIGRGSNLSIYIDTREKFSDRIKDLMSVNTDWPQIQFKCLPLADYLLTQDGVELLIERKSVADFCSSYRILKTRLHKMRLAYQNTALLLEEPYVMKNNTIWLWSGGELKPRMSYSTFSNFVAHQSKAGTSIYHTMSFEESIYRIVALHEYLPRLEVPSVTMKININEWFIMFPGIGQKTIKKLQNDYDTPLAALSDINNWASAITRKCINTWV